MRSHLIVSYTPAIKVDESAETAVNSVVVFFSFYASVCSSDLEF